MKAAHAARLGYLKNNPFIRRMHPEVLALAGSITQFIPEDYAALGGSGIPETPAWQGGTDVAGFGYADDHDAS